MRDSEIELSLKLQPVRWDEASLYTANLRISLKSESKTEGSFPGKRVKEQALSDLTEDIVARIQILGNKFLHSLKIAENIREKLLSRGRKLWNMGVIGSILRLIAERPVSVKR